MPPLKSVGHSDQEAVAVTVTGAVDPYAADDTEPTQDDAETASAQLCVSGTVVTTGKNPQ